MVVLAIGLLVDLCIVFSFAYLIYALWPKSRRCPECHRFIFKFRYDKYGRRATYCSYRCSTSANQRRRREATLELVGSPFTHGEVAERDGWRCGICHRPIDSKLKHPDPWSLHIDHIIPLAHASIRECHQREAGVGSGNGNMRYPGLTFHQSLNRWLLSRS